MTAARPKGRPDEGQPTEELIGAMRAGQNAAYEVLFRRYEAPLRAFLRGHTDPALRRLHPVEDLLQEVHLRALQGLDGFEYRRELAFFLWLCGIARRVIAGHCRALKRKPPPVVASERIYGSTQGLMAALARQQATPADAAQIRQNLHLLATAFEALDARRAEAIVLRYAEGLSSEEAAARMATSPGAFRVLLSRGLAELRRRMDALVGAGA